MSFHYSLSAFLPFQDAEACARARRVTRAELASPPSPHLTVRVIDDRAEFYNAFATDIVARIRQAQLEGRQFVGIFPVGPMPQYGLAAEMINRLGLSCKHVHTFNMDEYADENGRSAPADWIGSFQKAMLEQFFLKIDPDLRPPIEQIHFPTTEALDGYADALEALGGAGVCYGGIGWSGHIAFWEPQIGLEFGVDLEAYQKAGPRLVELHPMTIMQNALHSFGGDWSWVPPKANTIGPAQILGARARSFWLDGDLGGGVSWQRFIARLVTHGPVNTLVPGSMLQTAESTCTILGCVADDVEIHMA